MVFRVSQIAGEKNWSARSNRQKRRGPPKDPRIPLAGLRYDDSQNTPTPSALARVAVGTDRLVPLREHNARVEEQDNYNSIYLMTISCYTTHEFFYYQLLWQKMTK